MYTSKLTAWTSVRYRFAKLNLLSLKDLIWVFKALRGINRRAQQIACLLTGPGNPGASWDANWNDPRVDWEGEGGLGWVGVVRKEGWGAADDWAMSWSQISLALWLYYQGQQVGDKQQRGPSSSSSSSSSSAPPAHTAARNNPAPLWCLRHFGLGSLLAVQIQKENSLHGYTWAMWQFMLLSCTANQKHAVHVDI